MGRRKKKDTNRPIRIEPNAKGWKISERRERVGKPGVYYWIPIRWHQKLEDCYKEAVDIAAKNVVLFIDNKRWPDVLTAITEEVERLIMETQKNLTEVQDQLRSNL